jgi:hypothetical protein
MAHRRIGEERTQDGRERKRERKSGRFWPKGQIEDTKFLGTSKMAHRRRGGERVQDGRKRERGGVAYDPKARLRIPIFEDLEMAHRRRE